MKMKGEPLMLPTTMGLQVLVGAWEEWKELERKGKLIMKFSPTWWLNKGHDPMFLFCKWVLDEIEKTKKKEKK